MEIDAFPPRSLTAIVTRATADSPVRVPGRRGPYAPPTGCDAGPPSVDLSSARAARLCRILLRQLLVGDAEAVCVFDELSPDVVLWTPSAYAATNLAVIEVLLAGEEELSPMSDVAVTVRNIDVAPPRVILEWQVVGRVTRSFFVADDRLVEPTGLLVETAGSFIVTFGASGVAAMHLYHDALAMLEQLLTR